MTLVVMDGIVDHSRTAGSAEAYGTSVADVRLIVTDYHLHQARTQRRRAKARQDAPRRAEKRRSAVDAAIDTAHAIEDAAERKLALVEIDDKEKLGRKLAETARSVRERVRLRMKYGFENPADTEVGGRMRAPFVEKGLRSDRLGAAGKMFVRACRKARFLRSADEKGFILVQTGRKVLNLDFAWVEGNREMVSLLRVDLDRCFDSFDKLKALLQALVDAGDLPCMPHLAVGDVAPARRSDRGADGVWRDSTVDVLARPHLWFILPKAINFGPKGREAPKRLFESVYRGLCNVLLPLGADPNAKALLVRGKNPLSPWWHSRNFNDESFPSLSRYAAVLGKRMCVNIDVLARMAAEEQSGLSTAASNEFFNASASQAWRILRDLHRRRDREYLAALDDRSALRNMLARLMPMESVLLLGNGRVEPQRGAYVLDKVVGYAARRWNPEKADAAAGYSTRGKLRHLVDGMETKQAQGMAGRKSAEAKQKAAREAVMNAMDEVEASGSDFTRAEVARVSGLDRKTVSKHWRFCEARRPNRCVDKKEALAFDRRDETVEERKPLRSLPVKRKSDTANVRSSSPAALMDSNLEPAMSNPFVLPFVTPSAVPEAAEARKPVSDAVLEAMRRMRLKAERTASADAVAVMSPQRRHLPPPSFLNPHGGRSLNPAVRGQPGLHEKEIVFGHVQSCFPRNPATT